MKKAPIAALVAISETGSISAAARKLQRHRSQISTWISDLEMEWELDILDRSHYRPLLTEKAEQLLPYCRQLLSDCTNLEDAIENLKQQENGITVGFDFSLPNDYRTTLAQLFCEHYPHYQLSIGLITEKDIIQKLKDKDVQLVISHQLPVEENLHIRSKQAHACQYAICCHPDHPLAQMDEVKTTDLYSHQAVLISGIRELFKTQSYIEVPDYDTAIQLARTGLNWCVAPMRLIRRELKKEKLIILNHVSAVLNSPVNIYWHVDHAPQGLAQKLLHELPTAFAALEQ